VVKTIGDIVYYLSPEDLFKEHFIQVVNADSNSAKANVFIIGYNCDKGVRAKGGRSGSETGPECLRKILYTQEGDILKQNNVSLFDLGDFNHYLLP
jgi:arginase family enzyme